jgi:serine protease
MKKNLSLLVFGLILFVLQNIAFAQSREQPNYQEMIVDFQDSASEAEVRQIANSVGITLRANSPQMVSQDRIYTFDASNQNQQDVINRLRQNSLVQSVGENTTMHMFWTPNDPQFGDQWGFRRTETETAWNYTCGRNIRVAVVDTGVACENHQNFSRLTDLAHTRCVQGWNFVSDDEHPNDDQGHGTHVAGTIAQTTNNAFGGAGIAHCSTIIPVKVLDRNGSGTTADVVEGIRFAADSGAHVINLSLGGGGRSKIMEDVIAYARSRGSVVVCAAGNNGRFVESPASEPGAFTVSAIGVGDQIAPFSSRGPEVDIAAPGVNILQQTICDHGRNHCEEFASWSGTSMATPHVAGIAALIMSMGVTNPSAVESVLRSSAQRPDHGIRDPNLYGAGIANAATAVKAVQNRQLFARSFAFCLILAAVFKRIKDKGGKLENPVLWVGPAFFAAYGLFFLPRVIPHTIPAVEYLMRPPGDWTILSNLTIHKFLPLGSSFIPLGLAATFYNNKRLRPLIGGYSLGTAAYLLGTFLTNFHASPFGWFGLLIWTVANVVVMSILTRLTLDSTKNNTQV